MPKSSVTTEERRRAIEILLLWEGRVSRGRLLELFDVHGTVLSRDIATYREAFPDVSAVVGAGRAYIAQPWMRPHLTAGRFQEYLQLIGATGRETVSAGVQMVSSGLDTTSIRYSLFSVLHNAIRDGASVKLTYRSIKNPKPHERTIRPHSLIQAGPRWHVRGYCQEVQAFRDFNLGRISSATPDEISLPGNEDDHDWNTFVELRLRPHRDLDEHQSRLIRDEYMLGTAQLVLKTRTAMVQYAVHAHRAAITPDTQRPPDFLLMVHEPEKLPTGALWRD